ncbi:MAG: hypothetical protein CMH97_00330 [Oceanospirillaceae bacterium]|nr:hypothetical protein [Oceanospirillaceae bacterium]|tara:strand:+ start:85 stop:411 length:327 start_codon:yes stop_codon:yes gene_type:complete
MVIFWSLVDMQSLIKRTLFLLCFWLSGWWFLDRVKINYSCFTVFPEAGDLESCRELVVSMHTFIDPLLLEKINEASAGVLVINILFYLIMSVLSFSILYSGFKKEHKS